MLKKRIIGREYGLIFFCRIYIYLCKVHSKIDWKKQKISCIILACPLSPYRGILHQNGTFVQLVNLGSKWPVICISICWELFIAQRSLCSVFQPLAAISPSFPVFSLTFPKMSQSWNYIEYSL